jgi:N-ethylmaleimide reductase
VAGWRQVADAVHAKAGKIFVQLMHTGRIGHESFLPDGVTHVAPSALPADVKIFTGEGMRASAEPVALDEDGIQATIADFARSARLAMAAGFDGVELHGANGYLLHQFLAAHTNRRTDRWGGDVEARIQFPLAVVRAVADEIGAQRLGLRISPGVPNNDMVEDDAHDTYEALATELNRLGLAYLHIFEGPYRDLTLRLRGLWRGALMLNPSTPDAMTSLEHLHLIEDGTADLISFAALFLANPDLPAGWPPGARSTLPIPPPTTAAITAATPTTPHWCERQTRPAIRWPGKPSTPAVRRRWHRWPCTSAALVAPTAWRRTLTDLHLTGALPMSDRQTKGRGSRLRRGPRPSPRVGQRETDGTRRPVWSRMPVPRLMAATRMAVCSRAWSRSPD